ncbi:MAG: hypothetical protein HRT77_03710 [Halioglobus sp.]|nr:hypothetical protein [Halioglobus sp.]
MVAMDVILIILGLLGFGAIIISTYVFMVAARSYVSDDQLPFRGKANDAGLRSLVPRRPVDRRRGSPVSFPLTVNGILIAKDRRVLPDRRATP